MMTVESERGTPDRGVDAESTPTPKDTPNNSKDGFYADGMYGESSYSGDAQGGATYRRDAYPGDAYRDAVDDPAEDSPETLRTRADSLLDEMMLGAVDVSAADFSAPDPSYSDYAAPAYGSGGAGTAPYSQAPYSRSDRGASENGGYGAFSGNSAASDPANRGGGQSSWPSTSASRNGAAADYAGSANGSADYAHNGNGASSERPAPSYSSDVSSGGYFATGNSVERSSAASGVAPAQRQNGHASEEDSTPTPTPEWRVMSGGGTPESESSTWTDYVSAFRSPTDSYGESSGQIQKWQPDSPADGYTPPRGNVEATDEDIRIRNDAGGRDYTGGYSRPASNAAPSSRTGNDGESDAAQSDNLGYVSAMSVMPKGPRRSSLLPRMSRFDVDALNREIAELHEEIRTLLPVGHDQAERAQHLLDKAHTIAASDPQRSAEVEYYMQQVRTIVERTRQSRRWSDLYRDRLRTYLLAWAVLATMTLTALLLSQFQIEAVMAGVFDAARDGVFMRNFAGALGSMMAGALGGAIGSLLNMGKHARSQYGFFDRKYGLRGLMLPIIGALVGLVVYSLFALVYHIAGINPSLSAVAMATPALLAFVFGFSQESLYGTTS